MCFRSASGCSADRLMSRSRMARIRGQSVLEILEEDRFFISRRLPKRDQVNLRRCFGMHDGYGDSSKQAERDKALFVVREAIVLESESRPLEYSGCVNEVQPMLLQVATTFPFIPGKPHRHSVYTARPCVKSCAFALKIEFSGGARWCCRGQTRPKLFHRPLQRAVSPHMPCI